MEKRDWELIQKHIPSDSGLKECVEKHHEYERILEDFNRRLYLTPEEGVERKRIQKLKLAGRDRIETLLKKYRSQPAGGNH